MRITTGLVLLAVVGLSSCSTTSTRVQSSRTTEIYGPGVLHLPVVADLNVREEKVSATVTGSTSGSTKELRDLALAEALEKAGADVLVEPVFESESTGTRITITVTGYPATYENFRQATHDDIGLLQIGVLQRTDQQAVATSTTRKGRGGVIVLATIAVVALTAGLIVGLGG